jgi:hypothetical protein
MVRIYLQPLPGETSILVTAHLERNAHDGEVSSLVFRPQDRPVGRAVVGVCARGEVQLLYVRGVDGNTLRTQQIALGEWQPVL